MSNREPGIYVGGELMLPAAEPDELETNLDAEIEELRAKQALVEAVRAVVDRVTTDSIEGAALLLALYEALERYDAAWANYPYGTASGE